MTAQTTSDHVVRFTGFLGDLRFAASDLRAELVGTDPETRQIGIAMDKDATTAFTVFTQTHVNQRVTLFICGQEVLAATLQSPIESGLAITGPIPVDRAIAMVDALNGLRKCPE